MNNRRKRGANKLKTQLSHSHLSSLHTTTWRDITLMVGKCFPGSFAGPTVEETLPAPTLSTLATFLHLPPVPTTVRSPVMPRQMIPCPWRTVVCKCFFKVLVSQFQLNPACLGDNAVSWKGSFPLSWPWLRLCEFYCFHSIGTCLDQSSANTFPGKGSGVWRKIFGLVAQQTQRFLGPGDCYVAK